MKFHFRGLVKNRKRSVLVFLLVSVFTILFFQNCGFQVMDGGDRSPDSALDTERREEPPPDGGGGAPGPAPVVVTKAWADHRIHTAPGFDQIAHIEDLKKSVRIGSVTGDVYFLSSFSNGHWTISRANPSTGDQEILISRMEFPKYDTVEFEIAEESGFLVLAFSTNEYTSVFPKWVLSTVSLADKKSAVVADNIYSAMLSADGLRLTFAGVTESGSKMSFFTRVLKEGKTTTITDLTAKSVYPMKASFGRMLVRSTSPSSNIPFFYASDGSSELILVGEGAPENLPKSLSAARSWTGYNWFGFTLATPSLKTLLVEAITEGPRVFVYSQFIDKNGSARPGVHTTTSSQDKVISLDKGVLTIYRENSADVTVSGFEDFEFFNFSQDERQLLLVNKKAAKARILNLESSQYKEIIHDAVKEPDSMIHGVSNSGEYILVSHCTDTLYRCYSNRPVRLASIHVPSGRLSFISKKKNTWYIGGNVEFQEISGRVIYYEDWALMSSNFDGTGQTRLNDLYANEAEFTASYLGSNVGVDGIQGNWGQWVLSLWSEKHKRLIFSPFNSESGRRTLRAVSLAGGDDKLLSTQGFTVAGLHDRVFQYDLANDVLLLPVVSGVGHRLYPDLGLATGTFTPQSTRVLPQPSNYWRGMGYLLGSNRENLLSLQGGGVLGVTNYGTKEGEYLSLLFDPKSEDSREFSEGYFRKKSGDDRWLIFKRKDQRIIALKADDWKRGTPKAFSGTVPVPEPCTGCFGMGYTDFAGDVTKKDKVLFFGFPSSFGTSNYGFSKVYLSDLTATTPVPVDLNLFWAEIMEDRQTIIGSEAVSIGTTSNGSKEVASSAIVKIDSEDLTQRKVLSSGHHISVLPGGKYVVGTEGKFWNRSHTENLFVLNTDSGEKTRIAPDPAGPLAEGLVRAESIRISQSQRKYISYEVRSKVYSSCLAPGLVMVNVDGSSRLELSMGPATTDCSLPKVPVNEGNSYIRWENERIYVARVSESWKEKVLPQTESSLRTPYYEVSPDESLVAFVTTDSEVQRLFIYNTELDEVREFADPIPMHRRISKISFVGAENQVLILAQGIQDYILELFKFENGF